MMDKSLGQIAYEDSNGRNGWWSASWPNLGPEIQKEWERISAAVAAAVKEEDARIIVDLYDRTETRNINDFAAAIRASIRTEVK